MSAKNIVKQPMAGGRPVSHALSGSQALLASTTVFAILITKLVDFLRNAFDKDARWPKWSWNLAALGLGIAVALIFQVNIFATISHTHVQGWAGQLLTGGGIGAGGSAWHEVLDTLSSSAKRLNPAGAPKNR
jgi:hypothetical protein